ncbi:MAG: hypothetical protein Q8O51_00370 [bacterium]|nr:hypothetical protein [bacterium]
MKNIITVLALVLGIMLCTISVFAEPISPIEWERIDSLLQKVDIPVDIRQEFSNKLASHPDIEVSDGDMTIMWYITKDTVRFGIIPMPAGQGMKQWNLSRKLDGWLFYNNYQLVSMDEGRAIGLRIVRVFDGLAMYVCFILLLVIIVVIGIAMTDK